MDYGYSTFLGRQVQARDLDYGHTAQLQVVCPCCKEPVHKGVRTSSRGTTHYLAHYMAENADLQQCELRTGAETVPFGEGFGGLARNQKLETFADVLREELDGNNRTKHVPRIRQELQNLGSLTAVLRSLRIRIERHRREAKGGWRNSTNHLCREFILLRNPARFAAPETTAQLLEDKRRSRRSLDLFDQLLTVPGRDAFDLVACHAMAIEVLKGQGEIREHGRCITPGRGDVCHLFDLMLKDRARRQAGKIYEQAERGPSERNPDLAGSRWANLTAHEWFRNVIEASIYELFYDLDEARLEMRRGHVLRYDGAETLLQRPSPPVVPTEADVPASPRFG